MKEKTLDKDTIVAYHSFVQQRIRSDLNGLAIGPGWIPCRLGLLFAICSFLSLITGTLIIGLRSRHVYLIDWWAQFTGPFFIILFLLFAGVSTYLILAAKRRSNLYRRELFFRPIGDFGVAVVHKSNLQFEQETKPELKSGTTPHRGVLPDSRAYSERRRQHREGRENRGYDDQERRGERRERDPREEGQRRERRERDPRDEGQRRERRERDPREEGQRRERDPSREDGQRRHRDDRERRERDPSREDKERRERRERDRNDPREQERRARERKEREARGEMDPREKEYRERKDRERRERKEREMRDRPPPTDESSESVQQEQIQQRPEGRRGGRGAPKLPADSSGFVPADRVVLDADFGRPADTSSRASESEL